jgi:hypothetical protein
MDPHTFQYRNIRILQYTKFHKHLIKHVGGVVMTKCTVNSLKNSYSLIVPGRHEAMMTSEASCESPLLTSGFLILYTRLGLACFWRSPVCGMLKISGYLGSLAGEEIKTDISKENQLWVGQNGTIKIAFSTLSYKIFWTVVPIKLNGGNIYGLN